VEKYSAARQVTGDNIIRRMSFACWIIKATDIHSEYAIFIVFPRQKCLHERAPLSRYTFICCLGMYNQCTEVYCGDAAVAQLC
jgi:hypothetical protein